MIVRAVTQADASHWERLRQEFWPGEPGEHTKVIESFLDGDRRNPAEVFLALEESGDAIGFAEAAFRPYAEGCEFGRVAYLEGIFVVANHRLSGVGRALVQAVEQWARRQGCSELASDTGIENKTSEQTHKALGFEETARIICFRKKL